VTNTPFSFAFWLGTLMAMVLWCGEVSAESVDAKTDDSVPTAPAIAAEAEEAEEEEEVPRDPFWPIGYQPPRPEREAEQVVEVRGLEWPEFVVRGRIRGPDGVFRVLVAGHGWAKAGDLVSLERQDHWFHWRILNIYARSEEAIELGITKEQVPDEAWLREREPVPGEQEEITP
jgi:hypothetical protein